MNIIKVNYNNAVIKTPKRIVPTAISFHEDSDNSNILVIRISDGLDNETYYSGYYFNVYVNGSFLTTLDINSGTSENDLIIRTGNHYKDIGLTDVAIYSQETFELTITGYYFNENNVRQNVSVSYTLRNEYRCSESSIVSEYIVCNGPDDWFVTNNKLII